MQGLTPSPRVMTSRVSGKIISRKRKNQAQSLSRQNQLGVSHLGSLETLTRTTSR